MPVFFVYQERDRTYTLWGYTKVRDVDKEREDYPVIFFEPFEALPEDRRIKKLTATEVTGIKR
ncbi:MAG: hypothetical protein N2257_04250 [Thermodesulfovibrionales bacterium]|nr:hypothetical protein [Thermodesulfovibrionales bacterium]